MSHFLKRKSLIIVEKIMTGWLRFKRIEFQLQEGVAFFKAKIVDNFRKFGFLKKCHGCNDSEISSSSCRRMSHVLKQNSWIIFENFTIGWLRFKQIQFQLPEGVAFFKAKIEDLCCKCSTFIEFDVFFIFYQNLITNFTNILW